MSDKFTNNVRARLYKQGYQGFTKDDYTTAALTVNCDDLNNPTKDQLSQAVDYFKVKATSQLSVIDVEDTAEMQTTAPPVNEENQPLAREDDSEVTALALQEKSELVASTAQSMGIELQLSEVENIASHIEYSGDSLDEGINDIQSAITAFIEYKAVINQQKINRMITELRGTIHQRNQETSQELNNGLSQIAQDIKQANTDLKSSVRTALKCFSIPTIKAG
jgi:flagellar biosynthesis/type III secretory pathway protein FliH